VSKLKIKHRAVVYVGKRHVEDIEGEHVDLIMAMVAGSYGPSAWGSVELQVGPASWQKVADFGTRPPL
jgi:hypothetical protein